MLTLSYGYKKPVSGDKGNVFFPALEDDIVQLNGHAHDGITSAPINTIYLTKSSQTIAAAGWVLQSAGRYRQEVTMPAGTTLLGTTIRFEISGAPLDGALVHATIEKGTAGNKYYIYCNDNTRTLRALYI